MPLLSRSSRVSAALLGAIASTLTLSSTASAATFARVNSFFEFSNFSQTPFLTDTNADTSAVVIGGAGLTLAESTAVAVFDVRGATAFNEIDSFALGVGSNYLGQAISQARVVGGFDLGAGQTLSFDFFGTLELFTAIDNPGTESAFALGNMRFGLFGQTANQPSTLLDSLELFATLDTPGNEDILQLLLTGNPGLVGFDTFSRQVGGNQEILSLSFSGRYSRTFSEATLVSLVETKTGAAEVRQVPTPSLLWGLMTYGGLGFFGKLHRRLLALK